MALLPPSSAPPPEKAEPAGGDSVLLHCPELKSTALSTQLPCIMLYPTTLQVSTAGAEGSM